MTETGTDGVASREPNQRDQAAADARTRILDAAAQCVVRDGLANVRMAGIARTAGVSAGLLHYHFSTKEHLFADVLAHAHAISTRRNRQATAGADQEPAARLASFLDRCLPSDRQRADEWLLWQELALLCIRKPELAVAAAGAGAGAGAELYDDLYATVAGIIEQGVADGVFAGGTDARMVAETAVALCDGLGTRVLASDPTLTLDQARETLWAAVGMLVGHDGPLPRPTPLLAGALR